MADVNFIITDDIVFKNMADVRWLDRGRNFCEAISLSDSYSRVCSWFKIFTESISLADTLIKIRAQFRTFTETLHLQDSYSRTLTFYKTLSETISLSDTVLKVKQNLLLLWRKLINLFDIEGR